MQETEQNKHRATTKMNQKTYKQKKATRIQTTRKRNKRNTEHNTQLSNISKEIYKHNSNNTKHTINSVFKKNKQNTTEHNNNNIKKRTTIKQKNTLVRPPPPS